MQNESAGAAELKGRIAAGLQTPCILLDENRIASNYASLKAAFGDSVEIFFAMKANNHPIAVRAVEKSGGSFDIASAGELSDLLRQGIDATRITFSNPMKVPDDIDYAHSMGVTLFAADTVDEIEKLAVRAPGSRVYIRIEVDNTGSGWPLAGKFGASEAEAVLLLALAKERGLVPYGLTFHVGSQCDHLQSWRAALEKCSRIWNAAAAQGIPLTLLNLGGGFPAHYLVEVPSIEDIGASVMAWIHELVPDAKRVFVEPGRSLVAEAGVFVTSVIGRAVRGGKKKIFVDASVFTGLMEAYETFWYPTEVLRFDSSGNQVPVGEELESVALLGPTCDTVDIITDDIRLPKVEVGDKIVFYVAGAYTNSYEGYNGYKFPVVHSVVGMLAKEKARTEVLAK
jgi:ornithine decarboxylase